MARGVDVALAEVRDTDAASLIWPARMAWVGPETVTSLIEAHGTGRRTRSSGRPGDGEPGWPVLLPVGRLDALRAVGAGPDAAGRHRRPRRGGRAERAGRPRRSRASTHDRDTPRADLPPYVGPPEPPAGHVHEWGAQVADEAGRRAARGPALAPYARPRPATPKRAEPR